MHEAGHDAGVEEVEVPLRADEGGRMMAARAAVRIWAIPGDLGHAEGGGLARAASSTS